MRKDFIKIAIQRILSGFLSFVMISAFLFFVRIDFNFLDYLNSQFLCEFYLIILFAFLFLSFFSKNEKVKFFFESSLFFYIFLILLLSIISLIFLNEELTKVMTLPFASISVLFLWFILKRAKLSISKFMMFIIFCLLIVLTADTINMYSMMLSLKEIDQVHYIEDLDNIDSEILHYSIYSEIDTFNLSEWSREMDSEILLPPFPINLKDSLDNYDFCKIHKNFYLRLYFKISSQKIRKDIRQFNCFSKFFEEYYITRYFDRTYYLKNRKTKNLIKYKDFIELHKLKSGV